MTKHKFRSCKINAFCGKECMCLYFSDIIKMCKYDLAGTTLQEVINTNTARKGGVRKTHRVKK